MIFRFRFVGWYTKYFEFSGGCVQHGSIPSGDQCVCLTTVAFLFNQTD